MLHGRHFTYKSINGDTAITFVSTGVEGAFATEEHPYAAHGPWLQVHTPWLLVHTQTASSAYLLHVLTACSYVTISPQILLTEEFVEQMLGDLSELNTREEVRETPFTILYRGNIKNGVAVDLSSLEPSSRQLKVRSFCACVGFSTLRTLCSTRSAAQRTG